MVPGDVGNSWLLGFMGTAQHGQANEGLLMKMSQREAQDH